MLDDLFAVPHTDEPAPASTRPGFRLHRLEVLNWGTFDKRIWSLELAGQTALLTGDIGSGKSTLVDAITTLLMPANRVDYNKAAGADSRERSLRSYVLGYYKSQRQESGVNAQPVALRTDSDCSVILGEFCNASYEQTVCLAQVFWMKEPHGPPARFFVVAPNSLNIKSDFSDFVSDMPALKRKLRNKGAEIFDSFPPYAGAMRHRLGIKSEQALALFHQTVSMKSVGNLTEFVRTHMLEPFDVAPRIAALIAHFDDLNRAHEAVLKAQRQVQLLQPLVADGERHEQATQHVNTARQQRNLLKPYFAQLKLGLLAARITQLNEEWERHDAKVAQFCQQAGQQAMQKEDLQRSIASNGGERIAQLAQAIAANEQTLASRRVKAQRYKELAQQAGLLSMDSARDFVDQRQVLLALTRSTQDRDAALQNDVTEHSVAFSQGKQAHDALQGEITSLKTRRSNIPLEQIAMRAALCRAMNLQETDLPQLLPFAGELLQVRDDERDWEGAAERVLRSFGLSLLVPDALYAQVAQWVDSTHLKGRLVYFRVRTGVRAEASSPHKESLVRKLVVKPDSDFYPWLTREVARRFNDLVCCTSQDQFRREVHAVTQAGQIKSGGERHEKDDRYRLDDRGRYVLGWVNTAKIDALNGQLRLLENQLGELGSVLGRAQAEQVHIRQRLAVLAALDEYRDFSEVDWQAMATAIATQQDEKKRLESASSLLAELGAQLLALTEKIMATATQLDSEKDRRAQTNQRLNDAQSLRGTLMADVDSEPVADAQREPLDALLTQRQGQLQSSDKLTVESCDKHERALRDWLQQDIDAQEQKLGRLRDRIIKAMVAYNDTYRLETAELDASVESGPEYRRMLQALQTDDLPRFVTRFKELLNENTIREVANFQSQMAQERETIHERVLRINRALSQLDYNAGRYILLLAQPTPDADVRDFQTELRACTEGALSGGDDAQYSEAKFVQVKQLIERLRGRTGLTEQDRRWTHKVTDVRQWFVFAASERWRQDKGKDDQEHEHYADSGGKSGGQKEKLAYTILAASLAYQFGLEAGATRSRGFHFVVIDEAFGRGSDESAQYGLRLFAQLNLQLLIVTPLQKIHIIEPFVANVGFVDNEGGRKSRLRNLSIGEYRAQKDQRSIQTL